MAVVRQAGVEWPESHYKNAHTVGHTEIGLSSDKKTFLTCGSDGIVRFWNGIDDDFPSEEKVAESATAIACRKDEFFVATECNYIQVFTYPEKKRDYILCRFGAPVTQIVVSKSEKIVAACSCDMEIQFLNSENYKITTLKGHTGPVLGISIDPNDEYLASSSCDGTVKIWEIATGTVVKTFNDVVPVKNDFFKVTCFARTAWKPVHDWIFGIPIGHEIVTYTKDTWEEKYRLSSEQIEMPLTALEFSICGTYVAAASTGGEILLWLARCNHVMFYYQDPQKIGIIGFSWQNPWSFVFTDRLGRFGYVPHVGYILITAKRPPDIGEEDSWSDLLSTPRKADNDDDDNMSLHTIKSGSKNESGDEAPGSPASTAAEDLALSYTKPQPPFQPSSTPSNFEPRCLCYNSIGVVRYYDEDRTIDVKFHDTSFHHTLYLRNFGVCTMATLSTCVLCLAVPSLDENRSKFSCIPLNSLAGGSEWSVQMPENEDIVATAAGGDWVAVATSANHLRIFTQSGIQRQIVSLAGPVVCMSGFEEKLLVACHMGPGFLENQNQGFILYRITALSVTVITPLQPLPLFPKSVLRWFGFTDEGTPCSFDSEGLLRFLSHDNLHWELVWDIRDKLESPSDNYFLIGISELYQKIRYIFCKNSVYPSLANTPTLVETPLKLPFCNMETEKSKSEEILWRNMFCLESMDKVSDDDIERNREISTILEHVKQTTLRLFAEACRNSEDLRALDMASLMSTEALKTAGKFALKLGRKALIQKLNALGLVDVTGEDVDKRHFPLKKKKQASAVQVQEKPVIYSQQDMFEDSPANMQKEDKSMDDTADDDSDRAWRRPAVVNPFKVAQPKKNEGPKGLKFLDELIAKEASKETKPIIQPLPVKSKRLNKDKTTEYQAQKPTFVQWFSMNKATLSLEHPGVTGSELTKLGMRMYKQEMSQASQSSLESTESQMTKLNREEMTEIGSQSFDEEMQQEDKATKGLKKKQLTFTEMIKKGMAEFGYNVNGDRLSQTSNNESSSHSNASTLVVESRKRPSDEENESDSKRGKGSDEF